MSWLSKTIGKKAANIVGIVGGVAAAVVGAPLLIGALGAGAAATGAAATGVGAAGTASTVSSTVASAGLLSRIGGGIASFASGGFTPSGAKAAGSIIGGSIPASTGAGVPTGGLANLNTGFPDTSGDKSYIAYIFFAIVGVLGIFLMLKIFRK